VGMAEYIDREKAIEIIEQHMTIVVQAAMVGSTASEVYIMAKDHAIDYLRYTPTEDVVPVVRCKDCKYYREGVYFPKNPKFYCCRSKYSLCTNEDDYCSYGERKDQNE
jgi:hypothetical protein